MAKLNSVEFAEKWARRTKGSTADMAAGIAKVTEAPGEKAAKKIGKWIAKLSDPEVQQKWKTNVAAVSLEEWKQSAITLGVQRVAAGVDKSEAKMEKFAGQLIAHQEANLPKIHAMPDLTKEDSRSRMSAWFDIMSDFKPKK